LVQGLLQAEEGVLVELFGWQALKEVVEVERLLGQLPQHT
jgi:hypothetical protein